MVFIRYVFFFIIHCVVLFSVLVWLPYAIAIYKCVCLCGLLRERWIFVVVFIIFKSKSLQYDVCCCCCCFAALLCTNIQHKSGWLELNFYAFISIKLSDCTCTDCTQCLINFLLIFLQYEWSERCLKLVVNWNLSFYSNFVSHMSKSTENTHTHIPTLLYHYTTTTYFTWYYTTSTQVNIFEILHIGKKNLDFSLANYSICSCCCCCYCV